MQPVMRKALIGLALLACAILSADAAATVYTKPTKLPRQSTVVVLGRDQDKSSHGKFFGALEALVGSGNVLYTSTLSQLKKYGEYTYSNVILFGVQNDLSVDFLDFVDNGNGNVVVIARPQDEDDDESFPESQRDMAIECGVLFTEKNVEDAFGANPNVVVAGDFLDSKPVTGGKKLQPVHYHGLGLQLERNNPLLLPILRAPRTAVVPGEDETPQLVGGDIVLVAGLQARNGARMTFAGSTELFHDKSPAANHAFAAELLQWALQFRGVLRYSEVEHRHKDLTVAHAHETYRIKDVVEYTVKIEEFTGKAWEPYVAEDIQIEVVMLDPYIRTALKYDSAKQRYTADLHLPDVYGIFKFLVDYRRSGYAPLVYYNTTTIRPLKLNEYERFIPSAFPYYSTVFLCMGGFFLFSVLFFGAEGH